MADEWFYEAGRDTLHLGGARNPLQQNCELIAAQPGNGVRGARALYDPLRDCLQQAVTRVVTERIVDGLEVVEIEEQNGHRLAAALSQCQGVLHTVLEQRAIG